MIYTILIIVLILLVLGALPVNGWHQYGYAPSGGLGLVIIIIIVLLLMGRI